MRVDDLRKLSREELVERAESQGVARASGMSAAELIDALTTRLRQRPRSWLGIARELVTRVMERGLHLPEAAQILRGALRATDNPKPPPPLPTVTLAEIYAAQGHTAKALAVLVEVLERDPAHAEALALRERLARQRQAEEADGGEPTEDDEHTEPVGVTASEAGVEVAIDAAMAVDATSAVDADADLPTHYDVDEVVALATDPRTAYVYWELRPLGYARARAALPDGRLLLRVLTVVPSGPDLASTMRDLPVDQLIGDRFIRGLPPGSELRICLGWAAGEAFLPLAVAAEMQMPRDHSAAIPAASWANVEDVRYALEPGGAAAPSAGVSRAATTRLRSYVAQIATHGPLSLVDFGDASMAHAPRPSGIGPTWHSVVVEQRGGASDLYRREAGERGGASDLYGGASDLYGAPQRLP